MQGFFENCITTPTMDDVYLNTIEMANTILRVKKPTLIMGVARGGLIPAVLMSHYIKVKMIPVSFSSADGNGDDKAQTEVEVLPEVDKGTDLLIVDDICDSGETLKKMVKFYERQGVNVQTAVLFYKDKWPNIHVNDPKHGFCPTYFMNRIQDNSKWIIFPWEDSATFLRQKIS